VSRYRDTHVPISVYPDFGPDIGAIIGPDFVNRYRVFSDITSYPISGNIRYDPISGPIKKCPDIGYEIRIYGYRDIFPDIGTCKESRWGSESDGGNRGRLSDFKSTPISELGGSNNSIFFPTLLIDLLLSNFCQFF
jgi:hypothetical protein